MVILECVSGELELLLEIMIVQACRTTGLI